MNGAKTPDSEKEKAGQDLKPAIRFLALVTVCYLVSFVGYEGSSQGIWSWYLVLQRPSWDPPVWTFVPVWTVLYGLMAVALWQVWNEPVSSTRTKALCLFFGQLGLNGLWPWIFFCWHRIPWSVAEIIALWILILLTTISFWRLSPGAGKKLIPYLVWVAFYVALNITVWRMNR